MKRTAIILIGLLFCIENIYSQDIYIVGKFGNQDYESVKSLANLLHQRCFVKKLHIYRISDKFRKDMIKVRVKSGRDRVVTISEDLLDKIKKDSISQSPDSFRIVEYSKIINSFYKKVTNTIVYDRSGQFQTDAGGYYRSWAEFISYIGSFNKGDARKFEFLLNFTKDIPIVKVDFVKAINNLPCITVYGTFLDYFGKVKEVQVNANNEGWIDSKISKRDSSWYKHLVLRTGANIVKIRALGYSNIQSRDTIIAIFYQPKKTKFSIDFKDPGDTSYILKKCFDKSGGNRSYVFAWNSQISPYDLTLVITDSISITKQFKLDTMTHYWYYDSSCLSGAYLFILDVKHWDSWLPGNSSGSTFINKEGSNCAIVKDKVWHLFFKYNCGTYSENSRDIIINFPAFKDIDNKKCSCDAFH